jgi:hypothetical protein
VTVVAEFEEWDAAWCCSCQTEVGEPSAFTQGVFAHVGPNGILGCGPVVEAVWSGRYLIDVSTGEVLAIEQPAGFTVRDQASAEWVLERIFDAESQEAALGERLRIIAKNIVEMQAAQRRRVEWLRKRFEPELRQWAEHELEGKRTRSIRTPFGTLSFRKGQRKVAVDDEAPAVEWAEKNRPDAVKVTKKLLVSALEEGDCPPGCRIVPPEDRFKIECVPDRARA